MKYSSGQEFRENLKITNINKQTDFINITAISSDGIEYNMNYRLGFIEIFTNQIYEFIGDVSKKEDKEKLYFKLFREWYAVNLNNIGRDIVEEGSFKIIEEILKNSSIYTEKYLENKKFLEDKEKNNIEKHISDKDFLICLDRKGKELSSIQFADKLENITISRTFNNYICHRWFIWNI